MKCMRPPLVAIFFMTYFHRARGAKAPFGPPPPGSTTGLGHVSLSLCQGIVWICSSLGASWQISNLLRWIYRISDGFSQFHAVFWKIRQYRMLAPPPPGGLVLHPTGNLGSSPLNYSCITLQKLQRKAERL